MNRVICLHCDEEIYNTPQGNGDPMVASLMVPVKKEYPQPLSLETIICPKCGAENSFVLKIK